MSQLPKVPRGASLLEDLNSILAESEIEEAKKSASVSPAASPGKKGEKQSREKRGGVKHLGHERNPFKRKSKLGPGPRAGHNSKTGSWHCDCHSPYKCVCTNGKRKKVVRIKRGYKKAYNHEYKLWAKGQKR